MTKRESSFAVSLIIVGFTAGFISGMAVTQFALENYPWLR